MRTRFATALALLLTAAPSFAQEMSLDDFLEVAGQVRAATSPVENALVIAFSLSDTLNLRSNSGRQGRFVLPPLPVGVYRVVAVKRGYLPGVGTVIPSRKDHHLVLDLIDQQSASEARKKDAWTIRRSLPRDVLRQIEIELGEGEFLAAHETQSTHFTGCLESFAGYSGVTAERALERTSVALISGIGQWGVEFFGSRKLIDQPEALDVSGRRAEAADMNIEVRSSPSSAYRITSTRASWRQSAGPDADTGVAAHSLAWHGGRSSVQIRYQSHENLFADPGVTDEETIELGGNAMIYRGLRSDVGVSLRVRQESAGGDSRIETVPLRFADLATTGRYTFGDALGIELGVIARVGEHSVEVAPQTAAVLRLGERARVQVSGAYKFDGAGGFDQARTGFAYLGELPTLDTRYRYSVTISSDLGEKAGISAGVRHAAADTITFLLFDDRFDEFWDGLYLRKDEVLTDGTVSVHAGLGPSLQVAMITSAGRVDSPGARAVVKQYVSGEIQGLYEPSGTTIDLSYRLLEQPDLADGNRRREIERMSIVVGQSLHLPVELRMLVGFSVARVREGAIAEGEGSDTQMRLTGGLSFSF